MMPRRTATTTALTGALLALPALACLIACGGGGGGAGTPPTTNGPRQMTDAEMAARLKRMNQPLLAKGTKVVLKAEAVATSGLVEVSLGAKPGEGRSQVPNDTTATVVDDPPAGGFFQMRVTLKSGGAGEHAGKAAWVSRGDVHLVTSP